MNMTAASYGTPSCALCVAAADSDATYFARALADPRLCDGSAEALADSLGFCHRHGAAVLEGDAMPENRAAMRSVLSQAIPRVLMLTNESWLRESQVQQALFGADRTCPACTAANRALGRQAAAIARRISDSNGLSGVDRLCIEHFQSVVESLPPERRQDVLTARVDLMEHMVRRVRMLLRKSREAAEWPAGEGDAFSLASGRPLPASIGMYLSAGRLADAVAGCATLTEAITLPDICSICVESARARWRWLEHVQAAAGFDDDAWLVLPTCSEHLEEIARLKKPALTMAATARSLTAALRHQRQQIQALVQAAARDEEIARIKAEGPEVWAAHKRKRARGKSAEPPLSATPRLKKCPACDRAEIALEHATGKLLDLLHQRSHREAFILGYGLCLKHFARTYRISPKGTIRSLLADDLRRRLGDAREMSERAWPDLLHRFCGFA